MARPAHTAGGPGPRRGRGGLRAQPDRPDTRLRPGARSDRRPDPRAARHRDGRQDASARRPRRRAGPRSRCERDADEPVSGDRDRDHLGRGPRGRGHVRGARAFPEDLEAAPLWGGPIVAISSRWSMPPCAASLRRPSGS